MNRTYNAPLLAANENLPDSPDRRGDPPVPQEVLVDLFDSLLCDRDVVIKRLEAENQRLRCENRELEAEVSNANWALMTLANTPERTLNGTWWH